MGVEEAPQPTELLTVIPGSQDQHAATWAFWLYQEGPCLLCHCVQIGKVPPCSGCDSHHFTSQWKKSHHTGQGESFCTQAGQYRLSLCALGFSVHCHSGRGIKMGLFGCLSLHILLHSRVRRSLGQCLFGGFPGYRWDQNFPARLPGNQPCRLLSLLSESRDLGHWVSGAGGS